ncbi:MAG TPA: PAS domain S-box protein [Opitutaceae bacterium]|nr:PAS domain S-box protein [Opitutaceae bacterium]
MPLFKKKRPDADLAPDLASALRETQDKFAQAFHASADAVAIADFPSGVITEVNEAYMRLFGFSREQAVGHSGEELGSWATAEDRTRFLELLERDGAVREMEVTKRKSTGEPFICRITSYRTELGGRTCMLTRIRDITEQRAAEQALRESEEKFSKAFRAAPDVFAITTLAEGKLLDFNSAFTRTFGWTRAEALGKTTLSLGIWANPDDRARVVASLRAGKVVHNEQVIFRDKQGTDHPCIYFGEVTDIAGTHCLISILRDVTEQQRLEEQLRQAQKMESIGLLAGGVAHDFNNVLTVIQGNVALSLEHPGLPGEVAEMLKQVNDAAEFAATLTRQLLVFSRRQVLQPGRAALGEIARRVAKLLQRALGEHIALHVEAPPGLPDAHADIGMVEQVLLNLAVNARDAMPHGGELFVTVATNETDADYAHRVPQAKAGRFVGLRVRDTGVGIPPEILSRIFDPFFTTKVEGRGTGLGLAMVYSIAQQHGGWVEVSSEPQHGSEFAVWFPLEQQPAAAQSPAPRPPSFRGTETLLLVEDKIEVRGVLESIFTRNGYRIFTAATGAEALSLWPHHRHEIDLLFTDIVMPGGMNGRELAERLRADRPDLKVIYCSGYDANVLGGDALAAPGTRFLAKPFNLAQTAGLVRELLDEKRRSG